MQGSVGGELKCTSQMNTLNKIMKKRIPFSISGEFGGEVFIIDVFYFDKRFGFGKRFGQEIRAAPWVTWLALR